MKPTEDNLIATNHLLASAIITVSVGSTKQSWRTKLAVGLAAGFGSHLLLDAVPHVEPSIIQQDSFVVPGSLSFYLALADNVIGSIQLVGWMIAIPLLRRSWWLLGAVIVAAWGPDVIMAGILAHHLNEANWHYLHVVHRAAHNWWMIGLADRTIWLMKVSVGSIATAAFFTAGQIFLYRCRRRLLTQAWVDILLPRLALD